MKNPGKNNASRAGIRLSVPLLIVLLVLIASVLIIYSTPVLTEEKRTSGNLSFTDGAGSLINGAIEISMTGAPSGGRSNVNSITWSNAPNAWIYFDALGTKSISINLWIADDSSNGRVSLEDYGAAAPEGVDQPAPGMPVKYVELNSTGVSFADADVSIHYTDAELNGLDEKSLVIYSYYGGAWNELPAKVDPAKNVVTATVDSLSIFAVSTEVPDEIKIRDTRNKPVISHIRAYDGVRSLKKEARASALETANVTENGELDVDALESKNVAVRLKLKGVNRGEVVLDDFGKKNPVSVPLPGKVVKYVEIGARNISFSSADITIRYTDAELNGGSEHDLAIYHWNGASWDAVPTIIDTANKTLSATTTSLSSWGVATTYIYYLENNNTAGNVSVGTDGRTNYSASGLTIPLAQRPYMNLLDLGPMGTSANIRFTTTSTSTEYELFRFYLPFNYSTATRISANTTFNISWNATSTTNNRLNVSLIDYNPATGAKTVIGNRTFNATLVGQRTYSYQINHSAYIIPQGNRLLFRINVTTGTLGTVRLYFNDTISNITVAESVFLSNISGYVTNASSGAPLSGATVQTNTSQTTSTNATGYYNFTLSNGTYLITASKANYSDNTTTVAINGAAVSNANIMLTPLPQSSGEKLLIATNRYVVLDDWQTGTASTNYVVPNSGDATTSNNFIGKQTTIGVKTLLIDSNGMPLTGRTVNFTIYRPGGTYATGTGVTDSSGVASYYRNLSGANFWGNWTVKANYSGISSPNSSVIYNWGGCAWNQGSCAGQHSGASPSGSGTTSPNSPYSASWEQISTRETVHYAPSGSGWGDNWCTVCHQSFDGNPTTGITAATTTKDYYTPDVHRNIRCDNASCHNPGTNMANHNAGTITIGSCSSASCHPLRTDISMKSTLNGVVSNYSNSSSGGIYDDYHTPNSTVPCIICHGPMHNITKPDESWRWTRNNDTEDTHCTSCHQSYNQHNATVSCTLCHSDDVHYIQVFSKNATGGAAYVNVSHLSNPPANCTLCHQNGTTWFNSLKNLTKAGSYSGSNPPQVAAPVRHSNNTSAGARWNPGYWTNSLQLTWCLYCHGNTTHSATALGRPADFDGNNVVNSSISLTSSWCSSCHWQGYTNGSDTYGSTISTFKGASLLVPPEITRNATYGANESNPEYFNHTNISIKSDNSCYGCHRNGTSADSITDFMHNLTDVSTRVSGPDCISCHDYNKTDADALHRINNTAMKAGVHASLNKNATNPWNVSDDNKKCWGCHSSNGTGPSKYYLNYYDMGDRFANPYQCFDCHGNSTEYAYLNVINATKVFQHFIGASNVTAANASDNSSSCVVCHNLPELKVPYLENDTYNTGLSNASHYTTNRTELRNWSSNTTANCSYCHQNSSTAFYVAMIDPVNNRNITNHSLNYNSSNPNCTVSQCHKTGWIHNITLAKPVANSTFCLTCHGKNTTSGLINFTGAVTSIKEKHNNSMNCAECHMNTSKDVHPVKYLLQNATYNTSNSTAVTCITCHQTTAVDSKLSRTPPKIPSPLYHSDNTSNGTIWNSYWTSNNSLTSCLYCHSDTKHNATALGRPASWNGSNTVNSSLNGSTWCSSCHYQGYSNYSNMTSTFVTASLSVPPEITNGTYALNIYNRSNYYNHSLKGYTDGVCRLCHGVNLSSTSTVSNLIHNVTMVNTCTGCHYSFEAMNNTTRPDRYVDFSMYNTSLHRSLSCTNCHTQGHKNIGARKACEDCHAVQADPITEKDRHNITSTPSTYFVNGSNVVGITDCTTCHNGALYNLSISTYGYWKQKDCDYCHTYPDKYYE